MHVHVTLGTGDAAIAGHLEPGTEVFTYPIVTVGVMNDTALGRVDQDLSLSLVLGHAQAARCIGAARNVFPC